MPPVGDRRGLGVESCRRVGECIPPVVPSPLGLGLNVSGFASSGRTGLPFTEFTGSFRVAGRINSLLAVVFVTNGFISAEISADGVLDLAVEGRFVVVGGGLGARRFCAVTA